MCHDGDEHRGGERGEQLAERRDDGGALGDVLAVEHGAGVRGHGHHEAGDAHGAQAVQGGHGPFGRARVAEREGERADDEHRAAAHDERAWAVRVEQAAGHRVQEAEQHGARQDGQPRDGGALQLHVLHEQGHHDRPAHHGHLRDHDEHGGHGERAVAEARELE